MHRDQYTSHSEPGSILKCGETGRTGISPSSIAEKVRSRIPVKPDKYDKNERADEIYRGWSRSGQGPREMRYDQMLLLLYDLYKPRILAIARNYRNLSPVFDDDDLLQTGLLGILQALIKYDHADNISMKFSTYLEWSIRNVFQRAIGNNDKFVEIYDGNDRLDRTMSYQEFIVKKRELLADGFTFTIKSRQCYFSDETPDPVSSFSTSSGDCIDELERLEML